MGFLGLTKKRSDGDLVRGGDPMAHIMPFVMRGRNESAVYYRMTARLANIQDFIVKKRREGQRITLFNVIVTAMLKVVSERPRVNRFVAGRRLYSHKDFEVLYVVKQQMTDDAVESVARVKLNPGDTIYDVRDAMQEHIRSLKRGELKSDDKMIRHFLHYPRWSKRLAYRFLLWLDFNGMMPKSLIQDLPFYSSVFISHLGSLGANAVFHHLYEFGTNSIFMTIGRPYEQPYRELDGSTAWRRVVDIAFTIDERICDGFYLVKSLRYFEQLLDNPSLLEFPESPHVDGCGDDAANASDGDEAASSSVRRETMQ